MARPKGIPASNKYHFAPEVEEKMVDLYVNDRWGLHRIGALFGYSGRPVETVIKKRGHKIRTKRESKLGDLNPSVHRLSPFTYKKSKNISMSKAENIFHGAFPSLEYYYSIKTRSKERWGTWVFTINFFDVKNNIAIEIDGLEYRNSARKKEICSRKELFLSERGILLLRIKNEDVFSHNFIRKVENFYAANCKHVH